MNAVWKSVNKDFQDYVCTRVQQSSIQEAAILAGAIVFFGGSCYQSND